MVNAATVANAMIDAHKLADAILDALERVGDRQDYYRLNHAGLQYKVLNSLRDAPAGKTAGFFYAPLLRSFGGAI